MKTTTFIGITLILIMLLLVLLAAFVFSLQGQLMLENRLERARGDEASARQQLQQMNDSLADSEATRASLQTALESAQADNVTLEGELVTSQQVMENLQEQIEQLNGDLALANEERLALEQAANEPYLAVALPQNGTSLPLDQSIEIVVVAMGLPAGTVLNLTVDEDIVHSFIVGEQSPFAGRANWRPAEEGSFNLRLVSEDGQQASAPVQITIVDFAARNAAIRAEIESAVSNLRGLPLLAPIEPVFAPADAVIARISADLAQQTSQSAARQKTRVFRSLDFLGPDDDLFPALTDGGKEATPVYYSAGSDQLYLPPNDHEMTAQEQWLYARELAFALQDQHGYTAAVNNPLLNHDARLAAAAFARGEAESVQSLLLSSGYFDAEQTVAIQEATFLPPATGELAGEPPIASFLRRPARAEAATFVTSLYDGDFSAVDEAWENALPATTEQILHPDRYAASEPAQSVTLPLLLSTLGTGWELVEANALGEFLLRQYLAQQLDDAVAATAAAGWGGDRYVVYWNEARAAPLLVLRLNWDNASHQAEFETNYGQYAESRLGVMEKTEVDSGVCWSNEDALCLFTLEASSLLIRTPDEATALLLATRIIQP